MVLEIQFRPIAQEHIDKAVFWYNGESENLGLYFFDALEAKLNFISKYPKTFSIKYDAIRTCRVSRFPYIIHYCDEISNNKIVVFAVIPASTSTKNWKKE
jgi:hypothetical protein